MADPDHEPYPTIPYERARYSELDACERAESFRRMLSTRRSVRDFSPEPIPSDVIREAIGAAAGAPSGANLQPWTFVVVTDPGLKRRIREAAEEEERENYSGRMPDEWLKALAPLQTDWKKEFLEIAPALIVVFRQDFREVAGRRIANYYVAESVGIACGFLLAALHHAGLATLTHTPSPMGFLREILERPQNEKPYLLIPVGYPAGDCRVPDITKKPLDEIIVWR